MLTCLFTPFMTAILTPNKPKYAGRFVGNEELAGSTPTPYLQTPGHGLLLQNKHSQGALSSSNDVDWSSLMGTKIANLQKLSAVRLPTRGLKPLPLDVFALCYNFMLEHKVRMRSNIFLKSKVYFIN
jgi:hypothetical protein